MKDSNSVYTNKCFENSEIKRHCPCQHDEFGTAFATLSRFVYDNKNRNDFVCLIKMWATSSVRLFQHWSD